MSAGVQVVFCMDTEGPCADPGNPELLATWEQVDAAMDKLFDAEFRARHPDPGGGQLRIGWFFLTWTGFTSNPRQRAFGYHAVRDHYLARWGARIAECGDEQGWHYHHPPASGVGNEWGLDWALGDEHDRILSRGLLERDWFPACYRAGGTIMDPLSSRWVDRWFPCDYSNRAPLSVPGVVDWSGGVAEWSLYHPDPEDFRRPGAGRRRMARALDLVTDVHVLSAADVEAAFEQAAAGRSAILSCFDHDYRDIAGRIDAFRALVHDVAAGFPEVPWRYAAPIEAARRCLGAPAQPPLELEAAAAGDVHLWSSEPLFQSLPWLAVRTPNGEVTHVEDGLLRLDETHWVWHPQAEWEEAAFGGSTDLGQAAVARLTPADGPGSMFLARATAGAPGPPALDLGAHEALHALGRRSAAPVTRPSSTRWRRPARYWRSDSRPGESVLDVGCGAGHLWRSLRPLGLEYHGIDSYQRAIEIGRLILADTGLNPDRLRALSLDELPPDERYDAVVCLSTLLYFPDFRRPLETMARAARRLLVVRSSFGDATEVRYLADTLLEPGFETMRDYFSIFSRADVEGFLGDEGFSVSWHEDERQRSRFGGEPEVVGGIPLPYEFLVAERR